MFTYICRQAVDMVTSVYLHLKFTNCRHFMIQTQYCTRIIYMYVVRTIYKSTRFYTRIRFPARFEKIWIGTCLKSLYVSIHFMFVHVYEIQLCTWFKGIEAAFPKMQKYNSNVIIMHCSIYILWPPDVQSRSVYIYLYRHQVKRGPQHYLPTSMKPKDSSIYLNKNVNTYEAWCSMFVINLFILPDRVTG